MKVSVLFFASLKEDVGISEIELDVAQSTNRSALLDSLAKNLGVDCVAPLLGESISIAINRTIEKGEFVLKPGDEVAFLPPVTGG